MRLLRGLRAQILLWTILPLILILILVSFGSITLHQQNMRAMVVERNALLAQLAATDFNDALQHRAQILQAVLSSAQNLSATPVLSAFDGGVAVYDEQGNPSDSSNGAALALPAARLAGLRQAALSAAPAASFVALLGDAAPSLVVTAQAAPGSQRVALGATSAAALHVEEILGELKTGPRAVAYIIDRDGRLLYHSDLTDAEHGLREQVDPALVRQGQGGAAYQTTREKADEHVVAYAEIAATGWGVVIDEPWTDVIVPMLQYTLVAPLVVLVAAVFALLAIYFGVWWVIRPLHRLGRASSRLAWGDFQAIGQPVGGIDEIGDLQRTLQDMGEQIRRYQTGVQDYIAELTQAQEDERRRLARELHDDTVQSLIVLSQQVKLAELALAEHGSHREVKEQLRSLSSSVGQTLDDVRRMIRNLRPVFLEELGLVAAVEMLVRATEQPELRVSFEVTGDERRLPAQQELSVYRVAQEALSNVAHHARATLVQVRLDYAPEGVTLTVEDNGLGFTPPEAPRDLATNGHFGLMGMQERTSLLGGHLSIRSAPGQGTRVVAFLPTPA